MASVNKPDSFWQDLDADLASDPEYTMDHLLAWAELFNTDPATH